MSHTCHAIQCDKRIPAKMFMCRNHWFMVPKEFRDRVWAAYRPGQEDDWKITDEYAVVAKLSICAVATKEGRHVTGEEDALTMYDFFAPEADTHQDKV